MKIDRIEISGFKSITNLVLEDISPYSVFAGPNGSGKSNLMDALEFVSAVIRWGAVEAIRKFRGFQQIHCYKSRKNNSRTFSFHIQAKIDNENTIYSLKIHNMDKYPCLEEELKVNSQVIINRKHNEKPQLFKKDGTSRHSKYFFDEFPKENSALMMTFSESRLIQYLSNIKIFRFDPIGAKEPDSSSADATELNSNGHNVATMLRTLEKDDNFRLEVIDWMNLLVPGMEVLRTAPERISGGTLLQFKEIGIKQHFPANLISDGTIYALCIMTAVLSRSSGDLGITLIEEPERGLHPNAIGELVNLMRDKASSEHPIFVTTHSESLVRASKVDELWLVNKSNGKTVAKNADKNGVDLGNMNLDTAWLSNFFDGGLPW
ncbi:MAG: hypothetical protein RIR79_1021 [Pseudomonadota bacterium]|jgi:predicted ATPase